MNDEPNISFVDTHPKSNRCYNYLNMILHPLSLNFLPFLIAQITMVEITLDAMISLEYLCKLFTFLASQAVDDPTLLIESHF